jgi:DtxR family transcriptional regulator, Mn-dependent transcriptional regulator
MPARPTPRPTRAVPYPEGMPPRHDPHDLSSAAQQYLLTLRVMAGSAEGGRVTAAQIARSLGVTTQASSEMFRRLVADGLVAHADGRELHLTAAGRTAADGIFRRHALLEWLLTTVVGLGWAESDDEAMRLQGAISPRVEARLDEMLGHPETCPHGNPIDAETARRRPAGTRLSDTAAGERATIYRITEEAEEDAGLLSYLEARALTPGAHITILARSESLDSLTLDGPRGRATLGLRPAALIRVLPGEADPSLFHKVPAGAGQHEPAATPAAR